MTLAHTATAYADLPEDLRLLADRLWGVHTNDHDYVVHPQFGTDDDYGDLPRKLHRVTIAGDVPIGVDGKRSYVIEGDEAAHYTPKAA